MAGWVGELSPRVTVLATASSLSLLVGRFRCAPGDPAWDQVNRIGDTAHVVFPRTAVAITPTGSTPITTDANRIVLYDAEQEYRRTRVDPRGDDCVFLALGEELLEVIARDSAVVDPDRRGFVVRERNCPPSTYAALNVLRAVGGDMGADPLATDELLLDLTTKALGGDGPEGTGGPEALVEDTRLLLARHYHERFTLVDVAARVGASPFHLHRRFRSVTGWTIHGYRDNLRLREGLTRILDGADDLAAVAHDLGYSSHSHFTARFRQVFGVTPSTVRREGPRALADAGA